MTPLGNCPPECFSPGVGVEFDREFVYSVFSVPDPREATSSQVGVLGRTGFVLEVGPEGEWGGHPFRWIRVLCDNGLVGWVESHLVARLLW